MEGSEVRSEADGLLKGGSRFNFFNFWAILKNLPKPLISAQGMQHSVGLHHKTNKNDREIVLDQKFKNLFCVSILDFCVSETNKSIWSLPERTELPSSRA